VHDNLPREIRTERLLLRRWRAADREPFAAMNADPQVRVHFPSLLSRAESDASVARIEAHFEQYGFGFWVVEVPGVTPFAGMTGLAFATFEAPFTPCVEIGWRLALPYWGKGYATEAARAAIELGFGELDLDEIVAFTVPGNVRSQRVMERLGMTQDPAGAFDHPGAPEGHPLRRCLLYRLNRTIWNEMNISLRLPTVRTRRPALKLDESDG
jgi:RimJ/RimL family protein N-acetyltransferase